jgi:hypothetical protein
MKTHAHLTPIHWIVLSFTLMIAETAGENAHHLNFRNSPLPIEQNTYHAGEFVPSPRIATKPDFAGRVAIVQSNAAEQERHRNQRYSGVENAYERAVRANRKAIQLFVRVLRRISTRVMDMPKHL